MPMHVKPRRLLSTRNVSALRLQLVAAEYKQRIGERIRKARDARGWTQGQLARAVEDARRRAGDNDDAGTIDASSVSRWERGEVEPNARSKDALAEALGVDVSYFMAPEPDKSTTPELFGSPSVQLDRIEANQAEILRLLRRLTGPSEDPRGELPGFPDDEDVEPGTQAG